MPVAEVSSSVRVRVPAKVNLHLAVGPLRQDGFHDLTTVFQAVGVYDEVVARYSEGLSLQTVGEHTDGVPNGPENLAWQAALLLAEHAGVDPHVHLDLDKAIPVAGGMAGGSADAAAALLACAGLWRTGTSKSELTELAAELGSDVPFPLMGGTALGTGRGEQLTPVLATGVFHWVFALADFGISAGDAYRELDRLRAEGTAPEPIGAPDAVLDALRAGDAERLAPVLGNDLEAASLSLQPGLQGVLDAGLEAGALAAMVSGSGPTCAFLCADEDAAQGLSLALDTASVGTGTRVAMAPVLGARVLM
ncbi:4-(cytidine 5'-diphospho)-2-C-methyl-D-erythritol kinase [Jatrophihabitans sp.]|uniref:4-(cytidine 5'-diphospho)-2-C-methyl-D-erythritol kinase n=1 Tax=Jatrophihabitans sp. TaxID=1932789 RepID=UPI0030C67A1F|nr:ispE [Jatrophihabitans sp.]